MPGITGADHKQRKLRGVGVKLILQLFMKAPVPGHVKTRLHPPLSHEQAARIHELLCLQLCETLCGLPGVTTEVWAGGDGAHPFFDDLRQRFGVVIYQQPEGDLGLRMQSTLVDGLARAERVVIVGGDCLSVDPSYVLQAFSCLNSVDAAVLGPADDGGYVLVGVRRVRPGLFAGVSWGGNQALLQTQRNFAQHGYDIHLLPTRWDIDTYTDLQAHAPALLERVIPDWKMPR